MAKKHDENKDLRLISRICKIDYAFKVISTSKSTIIGIRTWGKIDYLVNYCGWTFVYDNSVVVRAINNMDSDNTKNSKREAKKAAKEKTLTNKRRKIND